jgi:DNA-directed RNA polymerase specialized sigma24 family protein
LLGGCGCGPIEVAAARRPLPLITAGSSGMALRAASTTGAVLGRAASWRASSTTGGRALERLLCKSPRSRFLARKPARRRRRAFGKLLDELEDANSSPSVLWDQEHDRHVARRLMELIRPEFGTKTWQAFERTALDGARAEEVAAELRLSINAVLVAKSRVLQRLRAEARGPWTERRFFERVGPRTTTRTTGNRQTLVATKAWKGR